MPERVSFIHTADLHLGRKARDLGTRGKLLRQKIAAALERSADAALDRKADLFIVAGDLFDSPDPPAAALSSLRSALSRLADAGVRVVIAPGTHDPPDSRIYGEQGTLSSADKVTVLTPTEPVAAFDDLDLAVCAWFPSQERAGEWMSPPEGWHRGMKFKVALAHGSVLTGLEDKGPEDRLPERLLKSTEIDYLALGHHHGARPIDSAAMAAWYSGAPEMLAVDQKEAGNVLQVSLVAKDGRVEATVQKIKVGALRYQKVSADATEILGGREIAKEIGKLASPELFLDVEVGGIAPLDAELPDWEEMQMAQEEAFFKLRIRDKTERGADVESLGQVAANSVTAEFIGLVQKRIGESEGEERKEWEDALRVGLTYLKGSDIE